MPGTKWLQVGADPETRTEIDELCSSGIFTKAQILRAGLSLGVKAIKANPALLLPARGRKKSSQATARD